MLKIKNLDKVLSQLERWEEAAYETTRLVYVGLSVKLFSAVVNGSAQYSGDFAANWKLSYGKPNYTFQSEVFGIPTAGAKDGKLSGSTRKQGHSPAIAHAFQKNAHALDGVALGEPIFITNSAVHDEPYAWLIEEGKIKFRSGNEGRTRSRALASMSRYRELSSSDVQSLRRTKI